MTTAAQNIVRTFAVIVPVLLLPGFLNGQEKGLELSKGKAGPVEIGMSIDDLYQSVGKNITKLNDTYSEGFFSPVIEVYTGQGDREKPALVAEVVGACRASGERPSVMATFVVGRISVKDSRFKTNLGIGVGSTLGEIRRWYRVDWITFGEGPLVARVDQIGMSFALDYANPPEAWYTTHDAALIPDSARIVSILITDIEAIRSRPQPSN
jgi:hypothetical protein